jgi:uncharacterized repeat protein (TIGR01451 family)
MGRRLLLMLGIMLLALSTTPGVRAQTEAPASPSAEPPAVPGSPAAFPSDLAVPGDRPTADDDPPALRKSNSTGTTSENAKKKRVPVRLESGPDGDDGKAGLAKPLVDHDIVQAQAQAPAPAADGAAAGSSADARLSTAERLPLGKQSVAVSVDVQAPATMNLTKQATFKLIVRNTGTGDAYNVRVDDELPAGLTFISSQPEMKLAGDGHRLIWLLNLLPGGSDRVITIKVQPTKTGPFDHVATVQFETGCKSRTTVLQPRLKVDIIANPSVGKVLKGQQVTFDVSIQNTGDGPARNVAIRAKLSPGLKHESGPKGDEPMVYELTLPELPAGATEKLDPLVADAILGGTQQCMVTALSDDVVPNPEESENIKKIEVVEPKLKLAVDGPEQRYTDTVADYTITLENPGTAPARKVRVMVTLPISGKLIKCPPEARFDTPTSKLYWTIDQVDFGTKARTLAFQVRMGGIGSYDVVAQAIGEGTLKASERKVTEVVGIADVDLVVSESKRVLDVGGKTTFHIRLRNYGTKDATRLLVKAELSANLKFEGWGSANQDVKGQKSPTENVVVFQGIDKLGPGKEMILGIVASVTGADPKLATCRVSVTHDDLPDNNKFEDMAGVKVTTPRRGAVIPAANR